jgi:hypothetical protein
MNTRTDDGTRQAAKWAAGILVILTLAFGLDMSLTHGKGIVWEISHGSHSHR